MMDSMFLKQKCPWAHFCFRPVYICWIDKINDIRQIWFDLLNAFSVECFDLLDLCRIQFNVCTFHHDKCILSTAATQFKHWNMPFDINDILRFGILFYFLSFILSRYFLCLHQTDLETSFRHLFSFKCSRVSFVFSALCYTCMWRYFRKILFEFFFCKFHNHGWIGWTWPTRFDMTAEFFYSIAIFFFFRHN